MTIACVTTLEAGDQGRRGPRGVPKSGLARHAGLRTLLSPREQKYIHGDEQSLGADAGCMQNPKVRISWCELAMPTLPTAYVLDSWEVGLSGVAQHPAEVASPEQSGSDRQMSLCQSPLVRLHEIFISFSDHNRGSHSSYVASRWLSLDETAAVHTPHAMSLWRREAKQKGPQHTEHSHAHVACGALDNKHAAEISVSGLVTDSPMA